MNRPRQGQVTIRQIAEKSGISVSSVGDILAGRTGPKASYRAETRDRVMRAARELNYVPNLAAQRLRRGRSGYIGFLLPFPLLDPSFAYMLQTLEEESHLRNRRVLLSIVSGKEEEQERGRYMQAEQVEGLVFGPVYRDIKERAEWCRRLSVPTVLFGQLEGSGFDEVSLDFKLAADLIAGYVGGMGHRNVALLRTNEHTFKSIAAHGILANDQWNRPEGRPLMHLDQLIKPIKEFIEQWKAAPVTKRPTAVICHNDYMASLAQNLFMQAGIRVPDDLSLMGMGNLDDSPYQTPPLTTIDIRIRERIRISARILYDRIDGKLKGAVREEIEPKLVERASVKRLTV